MILYFLSLLNRLADLYNSLLTYGSKLRKSILNSQTPDVWIFPQRNAFPWVRKDSGKFFCYYPDNLKFGSLDARKSFDDVVTVELLDATGKLLLDCTEFFHNIRWADAPSIYEVVLTYLLSKDIIMTEDVFTYNSLRLMTLENPDLLINLNNPKAKVAFSTWSAFEV
jgi:hypothetical protein